MEWFSKLENQIPKPDNLEEINKEFKENPIPSVAITDIPAADVVEMFKLKREDRAVGRKHWGIAPTERRTVSNHLSKCSAFNPAFCRETSLTEHIF